MADRYILRFKCPTCKGQCLNLYPKTPQGRADHDRAAQMHQRGALLCDECTNAAKKRAAK